LRRAEPLEGYRDPKPMVFCGLYPVDGDEYADLREAMERLRLNDSSFTFEPETSGALGFGFRCGFLGLLHMEIIRNGSNGSTAWTSSRHAQRGVHRPEKRRGDVVDNPAPFRPRQDRPYANRSRRSRS
jgi:hypothetical protein